MKRDILQGISRYRIDRNRIKTTDGGPKVKGGQGTVVIGTIIRPEEIPAWIPEQFVKKFFESKYAIKILEWEHEDAEKSVKFFKVSSFPSYIGSPPR